jgi:hypothetical protein
MTKERNGMSETRIVSLFDIHLPYNIPLEPVFQFIKDFKPHIVVLGGDIHDFPSVSPWLANQSRAWIGGTLKENYAEMVKEVFEPLAKATRGREVQIVYLEGNHEWRLRRAVELEPNGEGYWNLEKNIPVSVKLLAMNVPYKASIHLYYVHGDKIGKHHSAQMSAMWRKSVLYGHVHDVQVTTDVSPIDVSELYKAASVGCLCTLNPLFMKNRPNRWVNGFNYAYIDDATGTFADVQVYIINGQFIANGRRYGK